MKSVNEVWKETCQQYGFKDTVDMRLAFARGAQHTILALCGSASDDLSVANQVMREINNQLSGFPFVILPEKVT